MRDGELERPKIKKIIQNLSNNVMISRPIVGTLYENKSDHCLETSYVLSDAKSSVSINLLKGFLKMSSIKYLKRCS